MSLRFSWSRLDDTTAEAVRRLLNDKLSTLLAPRDDVDDNGDDVANVGDGKGSTTSSRSSAVDATTSSTSSSSAAAAAAATTPPTSSATTPTRRGRAFALEQLRVTTLEWGYAPPYVELVDVRDAVALPCHSVSDASATASTTTHARSTTTTKIATAAASPSSLATTRRATSASSLSSMPLASNDGDGSVATTTTHGATTTTTTTTTQGDATHASLLADVVGPHGLFVKLHCTYGGGLRCSVAARVRYTITYGPIALPVRLPVTVHLSDLDVDCYVCINVRTHNNNNNNDGESSNNSSARDTLCALWLEGGRLASASPLNRMRVVTVFGAHHNRRGKHDKAHDDDDDDDTCSDAAATTNEHNDDDDSNNNSSSYAEVCDTAHVASVSSATATPLLPSSSAQRAHDRAAWRHTDHHDDDDSNSDDNDDDDDDECDDDDEVLVDEQVIGQFVLHELNALLRRRAMPPHYVTLPL